MYIRLEGEQLNNKVWEFLFIYTFSFQGTDVFSLYHHFEVHTQYPFKPSPYWMNSQFACGAKCPDKELIFQLIFQVEGI